MTREQEEIVPSLSICISRGVQILLENKTKAEEAKVLMAVDTLSSLQISPLWFSLLLPAKKTDKSKKHKEESN